MGDCCFDGEPLLLRMAFCILYFLPERICPVGIRSPFVVSFLFGVCSRRARLAKFEKSLVAVLGRTHSRILGGSAFELDITDYGFGRIL